jgi:hypothetical protein
VKPRPGREVEALRKQKVFLNFPYDESFEEAYLGMVAALVVLGRTPVATFEISDSGQGRIERIWELLNECEASIHDLSAVGPPARFNMPFELGLACALSRIGRQGGHRFYLFEAKRHRLNKTLSDLKGIDPQIHHGTAQGAIAAVLGIMSRGDERITASEVVQVWRGLIKIVPDLKREHRSSGLYSRSVLRDVVQAVLRLRDQQLASRAKAGRHVPA